MRADGQHGPFGPTAGVRSGRPARLRWVVLASLLGLQFGLQAYFFPLQELLTSTPLLHVDGAFHTYQLTLAKALCQGHQLVGYDPHFGAGYLGGVTLNASAKLQALLACAADLPPVVAYKVVSFWMGVLAPAALVVACMLLQLSPGSTAFAAVFALLSWWTGPVRWYHTAGLVSYIAIAYWVIPFVVAATRLAFAQVLHKRPLAGLAVAAALGFLVHPLFPVAAGLLALPAVLFRCRTPAGLRRLGVMLGVLLGCMLLVNGPWIWASLNAPSWANLPQPYQRMVDPWLWLREPLGLAATASGGSRLYIGLLLGLAAWGLRSAEPAQQQAGRAGLLAAGGVVLMVWASVGALLPAIGALQPNRFSLLAWLALIPVASLGLASAAQALRHSGGVHRLANAGCLVLALGVLVLFGREASLEIFSARQARYGVVRPEVKPIAPLSSELLDFLRRQTTAEGRVFFETSLARVHDQAHMAGHYALASQREFIGGPYPFTDFASAWDGHAFGRPLDSFQPDELHRLLELYNIHWMLCHSLSCRRAMSAVPGVHELASIGPITPFERGGAKSIALAGEARVVARCFNRVDVLAASGSELVLKYHWVPGLQITPSAELSPRVIVSGDRPFLLIRNPPESFTLSVGPPAAACTERLH